MRSTLLSGIAVCLALLAAIVAAVYLDPASNGTWVNLLIGILVLAVPLVTTGPVDAPAAADHRLDLDGPWLPGRLLLWGVRALCRRSARGRAGHRCRASFGEDSAGESCDV